MCIKKRIEFWCEWYALTLYHNCNLQRELSGTSVHKWIWYGWSVATKQHTASHREDLKGILPVYERCLPMCGECTANSRRSHVGFERALMIDSPSLIGSQTLQLKQPWHTRVPLPSCGFSFHISSRHNLTNKYFFKTFFVQTLLQGTIYYTIVLLMHDLLHKRYSNARFTAQMHFQCTIYRTNAF